jgi:hypothetical protein
MTPRKPLTLRDQVVGMCRVFLMVGIFFVCHAVYKYVEYTKFDEKPGFKLMFDWSVYVRLYEWGGKWAVVGFPFERPIRNRPHGQTPKNRLSLPPPPLGR